MCVSCVIEPFPLNSEWVVEDDSQAGVVFSAPASMRGSAKVHVKFVFIGCALCCGTGYLAKNVGYFPRDTSPK